MSRGKVPTYSVKYIQSWLAEQGGATLAEFVSAHQALSLDGLKTLLNRMVARGHVYRVCPPRVPAKYFAPWQREESNAYVEKAEARADGMIQITRPASVPLPFKVRAPSSVFDLGRV